LKSHPSPGKVHLIWAQARLRMENPIAERTSSVMVSLRLIRQERA
jgi:hypothetical protein